MISEETFAREEERLGARVHFHDGVWWIRTAPFYYKPVHEFRPFAPKSASPHPLRAFLGYSHQVPELTQATRWVRRNVLQGDDLESFSLERLGGKKRNQVRMGLRDCRVEALSESDALFEQMKLINISQARRFEAVGESGTFLPPEHYEIHTSQWREGIARLFSHQGHQFLGAFVGDALAAYVDLIQIEDTWTFGAVKSRDEFLKHRPVDALYFTILSMASYNAECTEVVNGGPDGERASLTHFKEQFLLRVVSVPYYSRTLLPMERLRSLQRRFASRRNGHLTPKEAAKACGEAQES